jgi:hypothetical protein
MIPVTTIRKALTDKKLFGTVLAGPSWRTWHTLLIAAMGEPLTNDEREIFTKLTGRAKEPLQRVEEAVFVVGRRGGKSRTMGVLAAYIAALCKHDTLVKGERGILLCIAPDQKQAGVVLDHAVAAIEASVVLKRMIVNRNVDTLELTNGVTIEVRAASFRRLRGPTYIGVIADEACFWFTDEYSANADVEILNAVRPGLGTTGGPLIIASSPYGKKGEVFETYRSNFGPDGDPLILVAQGGTRDLNETFSQRTIDRALAKDRELNTAEYLAQFRADISSPFDHDAVRACVGDYVERAPISSVRYAGFWDSAGGTGQDSWVSAVGHREGDHLFVDAIREARPNFSPQAVAAEHTAFFRTYGVRKFSGDHYGGDMPGEMARKNGAQYDLHKKVKSDLYRDVLPLVNSGRLTMPKNERGVNQFCNLERRTGRSGKDTISHPEGHGHHDDIANAIAGLADVLMNVATPMNVTSATLQRASVPTAYSHRYPDSARRSRSMPVYFR